MLSWFVPREAKFFDMFRESAGTIVDGTKALRALIDDLGHAEQHVRDIKSIEHKADEITHRAIESLHKTFITPFDRDDLYRLVNKMDDIIDYIDAASQRIFLFDIKTVTPEIRELGDLIIQSAESVRAAVAGLENMKQSATTLEHCKQVNRLENKADNVLRVGMAKLFREDIEIKDLIKLKEILELLESVTDRCKDVANIVEGIVLDHA